jgi:hypothetical protein
MRSSRPQISPKRPMWEMRIEVVLITVELALVFLQKNREDQRRVSRRVVTEMANAMKAGLWMLTPQGIAFDEDGYLIDGQHRLLAIVEAGVAVEMTVIHNAPAASFAALDQGHRRTIADLLGDRALTNSHIALARACLLGDRPTAPVGMQSVFADTLKSYVVAERDAIHTVIEWTGKRKHIPMVAVAPVLRAFHTQQQERLAEFCAVIRDGIPQHIQEDSAAILFRNFLLENRASTQDARARAYRYAQNALKAFLGRTYTQVLRPAGQGTDYFPISQKWLGWNMEKDAA